MGPDPGALLGEDISLETSHTFKEDKYSPLLADLSGNFNAFLFSIEVSVRGQVSKANCARLKAFSYRCCDEPRVATRMMIENASRASLLCSYSIFSARKEPSWASPNMLIVR